jgi:diguanylate cyclase (GGDEF)-like protein/PAS domain S-box-containing protein
MEIANMNLDFSKMTPKRLVYKILLTTLIPLIVSKLVINTFIQKLFPLHWFLELLLMTAFTIPFIYFYFYRDLAKNYHLYTSSILEIEKFKTIIEGSTIAAYIISRKGFIYVSPFFAELFGYNRDEIYQKELSELLSPDSLKLVRENMEKRFTKEGGAYSYQVNAIKKDGKEFQVELYPSIHTYKNEDVIVGNVIDVSEKYTIQKELIGREKILSQAQQIAGIAYFEIDYKTGELKWSPHVYVLLEIDPDTPPSFDLLLSRTLEEDRHKLIESRMEEMEGNGILNFYRTLSKDGTIKYINTISQVIYDEENNPIQIVGTMQDISGRINEVRKLTESQSKYKSLFENNLDLVYSFDVTGHITSVNQMVIKTTGYSERELLGKNFDIIVLEEQIPYAKKGFAEILDGTSKRFDLKIKHKNGHLIDLDIAAIPIVTNEEILGLFCIARDVTEQNQQEQKIIKMAYTDPLTGLLNRRGLFEHTDKLIQSSRDNQTILGIIFMDMDRLKAVNDNLGHEYGDQLIIETSKRILGCIRLEDVLARVGGDEFILIIPDVTNAEFITQVATRIMNSFKEIFLIKNNPLKATLSMGISIFPFHGDSTDVLISKADMAMYYSKSREKNNYKVYEESINNKENNYFIIQNNIEESIEKGNFFLVYQPRVEVYSGRVTGIEALIRWNHPEIGLVHPLEFISLAEKNGTIIPLGEWVLREALKTLKTLICKGFKDLLISVNVSPIQIQFSNLRDTISHLLELHELPPHSLELEVTETVLMRDESEILEKLKLIRNLGVKLSIDDFGTGNSSFQYIKNFSVDTIKIDKSFVRGVPDTKVNSAIISAMIRLTKDLNMRVVCEGVETEKEMSFLKAQGTDEVQGYYISKPIDKDSLLEFIQKRQTGDNESLNCS